MNLSTGARVAKGHTLVPTSDPQPPLLYADGVNTVTLTAATSKLHLYQVAGVDEKGEQRQLVQTLVMPTSSLVELAHLVLRAVGTNADGIKAAITELQTKILSPTGAPTSQFVRQQVTNK